MRDPLRRSCASKPSRCGAVRICLSLGDPSTEIVRVETFLLWRRAIFLLAKRPLEVVSWFARLLSQSRGRRFDSPLVRGSSGLKIAAFKYKRSAHTPAAPIVESQLLSTNIICGAHSRSSGSICAEQLAQSHLHRATCTEQLAQSNCTKHLRRAIYIDQFAPSTCAKRLRALAQSNLHRAGAE